MTHKPSILLITVDALRADHLGCYGYRRNTSPNIDGLAKQGVLFTQAVSQDTWTVPSVASILTSAPPFIHRVSYFADTIGPHLATLPEMLKAGGYRTAFIGPFVASTIKGLDRGFDLFDAGSAKRSMSMPAGLLRRASTVNIMARFFLKMGEESADSITNKALSWLAASKGQPFFLWLHYFDAHGPYRPPQAFSRMFLNDGLGPSENKDLPVLWKKVFGLEGIPHHIARNGIKDFSYYVSQYDGAIRFADENIGRVLEALKESGIYEDTSVVISADHGTYLGEHGFYFCHTGIPFEPLIRVPLVIKRDQAQAGGTVISDQVQSIDIAPTVLDMVAIERPETFQGESLKPFMENKEHARSPFALIGDRKCAAIRTKDRKVMSIDYRSIADFEKMMDFRLRSAFTIELEYLFGKGAKPKEIAFDLKNDPQETNNIALSNDPETEAMKKRLSCYLGGIQPLSLGEKAFSIDTSAEERLKSLGYL